MKLPQNRSDRKNKPNTAKRQQNQPKPDPAVPDLDTLLSITDPGGKPPTEPLPPRMPGIVDVQLANGHITEAAEMLIILRDRKTNRLIVQIGERAYTGTESDIHPEFRQQFAKLMKELGGIAPALGRGAKIKSTKLNDNPNQNPEPDTTAELDFEPTTLAGQIEKHLQAKLRSTRAFPGRTIHISDAPDGGVKIEVDGTYFDSVGAVSDAEVKAFIQQVVADWQESNSQE